MAKKVIKENALVVQDSRLASLTDIQARIYLVRGVQVMLAILYHVATKALNQAVKHNIRRFPERFMFQLTKEEFENWKSQIVTSNIYSQEEIDALKMGARRCPYAFTEQGVAQLSAVLHSDVAEGDRGQAPVPWLKISNLHVYSLICKCKGIAA